MSTVTGNSVLQKNLTHLTIESSPAYRGLFWLEYIGFTPQMEVALKQTQTQV